MPDEQEDILEPTELDVDEEEVSEDELEEESEEDTTAEEEQPEETQEDDSPSQEATYTAAELRQMRALIDAQLAEQEAQYQPGSQEAEEDDDDPFWETFKGEFGDGTWLPEEAVAALKEREQQQAHVFQAMMNQQAQAFAAMIDQVADKSPAIQRVLDTVADDVPEEFLPVMKEMLRDDSLIVLTQFEQAYKDPNVRPQLQAYLDQQYGAWKRSEVKKPVGKPPVGIADGGAPSNTGGVTKGYTEAQNKEWESARRAYYTSVTDPQELAKAKREYFS